ncbi:hypothetical protein L7F22_067735 [Adiantum nelumboides]|nr:hypothetical protein [Adiantum nelumboides]
MRRKQRMKRAAITLVIVAAMAMVMGCRCEAMGQKGNSSKGLPGKAVEGAVKALQEAGGYTTVALLLPYLAPILQKKTTLLIPSDEALRRGLPTWRPPLGVLIPPPDMTGAGRPPFSFLSSQQLRSVAKLHMIKNANLSFSDLLKLPPGTLLPTLLGPSPHYLHLLKKTPHDLVINNAHLHHPDLCPTSVASFLTCHGITSLLSPLPNSSLSLAPTSPPPLYSSYPSPPHFPYSYYTPSPPPPSPPPPPPNSNPYYSPSHPSPYPTYSNYSSPTYPIPSTYNISSPNYPTYSNYSPPSYPTPSLNYSSPYPTSYNTSSYPPLTLTLPPWVGSSNMSSPVPSPFSINQTAQSSPSPSPTQSFVPISKASHSKLTILPLSLLLIASLLAL